MCRGWGKLVLSYHRLQCYCAGQYDMHPRLEGPAVTALREAFADNWNEAGEWDWDRLLARPEKHSGGSGGTGRAIGNFHWLD